MHYYRFRSSGELAIKELLYDEIYFASAAECNDPFDGKAFLVFEADIERWRRLLECAWSMFNNPDKSKWEEQLSTYLAGISPLSFDAALKLNYIEVLLSFQPNPNPISTCVW